MVLQGLRKAFLKRKLKKTRGKKREAFKREISSIEATQKFKSDVKTKERMAFRKQQLIQAERLGEQRAKIQAEQKLKAIKSGRKGGVLGGFDRFLAGTGVAKGTAQVIRKQPTGQAPRFDIVGNRTPQQTIVQQPKRRKKKGKKRKATQQVAIQPQPQPFNIVSGSGRSII